MAVASAGTLSLSLTLTDKITAPLAKVNALAANLTRRAGVLAGPSGFGRLTAAAQRVTAGISSIVPPLGALTAIGSVAGVVRLADSFGKLGATLGRSAYRVQASVTGLSTLQGAARLAGTSAEDLTVGLQGLGDAVIDAVGGRDSNAWQYFSLLGVSMRDASGNARTASDVLPDVADGLARIGDPRLQARVMGALRLPESMLPFLRKGAAGIREYRAEVERYGAAMTPRQVEIAQRFEMSQARVSLAFQGLSNRITERLAPVLGGLLDRLAAWAANDDLTARIGRIGDAFEKWVADGGVDALVTKIGEIGSGISKAVEWMGGWENAAKTLGVALTANMVLPLAGIAASLAVITAFKAPAWMLQTVGARTLGIAGAFIPSEANSNEAEDLERFRRDPDAFRREAPALGAEPERSYLDRWSDLFRERLAPALGRAGWQFRADGVRSFGTEETNTRQQEVFARLRQRGWGAEQATGIVANLRHESGAGLDNAAVGDGGKAYGIAQWHPDRQEAFRQWSGRDIRGSTLQQQVDFIHHELSLGKEWRAGNALTQARSAGEAAGIVSRMYERPANGEAEAQARGRTAEGMLPRLTAPSPRPAPTAAPTDGATPGPQSQRVDVRVQLAGAVPPGTTVTTRTQDGGVRVERSMLGSQP